MAWRDTDLGHAIMNYLGIVHSNPDRMAPEEDLERLVIQYERIAEELEDHPKRFEEGRRLRKVANELRSVIETDEGELLADQEW